MDLATLMMILKLLNSPHAEPPPQAAQTVEVRPQTRRPGTVNLTAAQDSFADLSREIIRCYHPSSRFDFADVVETPWARQEQYRADSSALVKIQYTGVGGNHYVMAVAVLGREKKVRTAVVSDTAAIRYNERCQLQEWTGLE